ncbi:MAG: FAD-dependent oxidoreductase [Candidatus Thorarchaeota archaeon]|jgi:heterodisulfide reductase subunit A
MAKTVVVVGAGLAGIQVAHQLADLGMKVHLVEREVTVGGLSTHLGKVFPTDDCALCLDACEELHNGKHRRCQYRSLLGTQKKLTLHALTDVKSIKKKDGKFSVSLRTQPRFISPDRCVVCLECIKVCDVEVPDEMNLGRSKRKAVYRPIPQGVPLIPVIDKESCTKCGKCLEVCGVDAIDLEQKPKTRTVNADAVVITTGVDERNPEALAGYAYGECDDVLTQRELARLLDPAGPTNGSVLTASEKSVGSVTMILCAGSRDLNAVEYCSQACCTYSIKHAVMLRDLGIEVTICYMDLRVPPHSQHYLDLARELGVNFVRGKPDQVKVREGTPVTIVEDTSLIKRLEIESNLVVLASPLESLASHEEQFTSMLDHYGFITQVEPVKGIYACGTSTGPTDIPASVTEANSVALQVYMDLEGGA